jgi:hypothetical protein
MLTARPRVRIVGHGKRLRVRTKGDWATNAVVALRESCRASVAVEKAVAEAIHRGLPFRRPTALSALPSCVGDCRST